MCRKTSYLAAALALLIFPAVLRAGGPPSLTLPIDGVTAANADACGKLLAAKLKAQLITDVPQFSGVKIQEQDSQWFATMHLGKDINFSDIEAALKGSEFKIPTDWLRMFGHVTVVVDLPAANTKSLLDDLATIPHVAVAKSHDAKNGVVVTVDMPYPINSEGQMTREVIGSKAFRRVTDLSTPKTNDDRLTTIRELPQTGDFRKTIAKYGGKLADLRWTTEYACRAVGALALPKDNRVASNK